MEISRWEAPFKLGLSIAPPEQQNNAANQGNGGLYWVQKAWLQGHFLVMKYSPPEQPETISLNSRYFRSVKTKSIGGMKEVTIHLGS